MSSGNFIYRVVARDNDGKVVMRYYTEDEIDVQQQLVMAQNGGWRDLITVDMLYGGQGWDAYDG